MVSKGHVVVFIVCAVLVGFSAVNYVMGPFFFDVISGSMVPALHIGDLVVIDHAPFSSLQVGDIIVFHMPEYGGGCGNELIVHRIVAIEPQGITTKGDANPIPDEPTYWPYVTAGCYVGQVVDVVPYMGTAFGMLHSLDAVALVVLVLAVVLFADYFSRRSPVLSLGKDSE